MKSRKECAIPLLERMIVNTLVHTPSSLFSVHTYFLLKLRIIFYILLCKLLFTFTSVLQTSCLIDFYKIFIT